MTNKIRCTWPGNDPLMQQYHDEEWGKPLHEDAKLFEFMILDSFQAGLSWRTILHKRENFRNAFAGFDVDQVAMFDERHIETLLQDAGIIRNRLKIKAAVLNARLFKEVQAEYGTFDRYIWQFTDGKPVQTHRQPQEAPPVTSAASDAMSASLRKRGFKFVGSTICYAFMQAAGMVNDHDVRCFCHAKYANAK